MATKTSPSFSFTHLSLLFLLHLPRISFAADTISCNQSLSGSRKLISQGGNFALGFFELGNSSESYYIGIWFNKVSQFTPVWVANRDRPVPDPTMAELKISSDGNLVLLNQSKDHVWSTNLTSIASTSTIAVLDETGNLVLRDGSNSSHTLWQSFDHPTNTWLPGAKIG